MNKEYKPNTLLKELGFYRGVNLGGWMSQCDYSEERLDDFIKESDFETIASWGFDHVRLPVDYNVLDRMDGMDRVRRATEMAKANGLNVLIDLHKTPGFSFDSGEQEAGFFESPELQERFYRLWDMISEAFGDDPDHIMFDLLNEITDKKVLPEWQKIAAECISRIRKNAPRNLILVGSYNYNDVRAIEDLTLPEDDRLVYSFHCYEPHFYTHQGAYWDDMIDRSLRLSFEEADVDDEYFDRLFETAIAKAGREGRCLYCGEYGVIDIADPEDSLGWFRAINAAFERYGISRAVWSYKEMDFGISDARMDHLRNELLKLM